MNFYDFPSHHTSILYAISAKRRFLPQNNIGPSNFAAYCTPFCRKTPLSCRFFPLFAIIKVLAIHKACHNICNQLCQPNRIRAVENIGHAINSVAQKPTQGIVSGGDHLNKVGRLIRLAGIPGKRSVWLYNRTKILTLIIGNICGFIGFRREGIFPGFFCHFCQCTWANIVILFGSRTVIYADFCT